MPSAIATQQTYWTQGAKIAFRFVFVYFFLQCVPLLDWRYYQLVFSVNWLSLRYEDIFNLAHYQSSFFTGGQSFVNWIVVAVPALIGAGIWTTLDKNKTDNYDRLYYWIRVIVRYRLAIGIVAYGFIKFFPLQSPYPSLSNLNTNYGDFTRWKLFSMSLGVVPHYELFLGLVEIIAGLLLFWRKTASVGALIVLFFTGNVFMSNIAYEGGEYVYSFYLIVLALFTLAYDAPRLANLFIWRRPAQPNRFRLLLVGKQKYVRRILKGFVFFFFVVLYGFKTGSALKKDPYQIPHEKGLSGAAGIYDVSLFVLGHDTIPYSKTDSTRWQDVVLEKWATLSIRTNIPVTVDSCNTEKLGAQKDIDRTYESQGSNERSYYAYKADTVSHILTLHNKNPHYKNDSLVLNYQRQDSSRIILSGINQQKDSIYIVLDKIKKKYLVKEAEKSGRSGGLKL